jgi:peptidoglycan lytic transglycosylase
MKRWLIILVLAAVTYPGLAAAATKSEPSFWQRLVAAITPGPTRAERVPTPRPAYHVHARPAATTLSPNPLAALVAPLAAEPAPKVRERSTGAAAGCNGGHRVISAYYWEGRHTASGEAFNPQGMTAAHRTLPFGTRLTVMNPRTGQSVAVVINDRGPFVQGVSLDLSRGAAQAIGMHGTGAVCLL